MFQTLVDKDNDLTCVIKFQHLRTYLAENAYGTIQSLEVRTENYAKLTINNLN